MRPGSPVPLGICELELFDTWCEQNAWTQALHDFFSTLLNESLPQLMRQMRELSSAPHAGTWRLLSPSPRHPSPKWASRDWQALLLWICSSCGACQDAYGDHALSCTGCGLYKRHNIIRDTIATLASAIGLACRTEEPLEGFPLVPGDVFLPSFASFTSFASCISGDDGRRGC